MKSYLRQNHCDIKVLGVLPSDEKFESSCSFAPQTGISLGHCSFFTLLAHSAIFRFKNMFYSTFVLSIQSNFIFKELLLFYQTPGEYMQNITSVRIFVIRQVKKAIIVVFLYHCLKLRAIDQLDCNQS